MYIIVDAYNFLKFITPDKQIPKRARDTFLRNISRYALKKGHRFLVVFDGQRPWTAEYGYAGADNYKAIEVVYSGDQSADEYIASALDTLAAANTLLISSDNELARTASSYGVPAMEVVAFYTILKDFLKQPAAASSASKPTVLKTSKISTQETDELMSQAAGLKSAKKESDEAHHGHMQKDKLSKNERRLLEIIKKL